MKTNRRNEELRKKIHRCEVWLNLREMNHRCVGLLELHRKEVVYLPLRRMRNHRYVALLEVHHKEEVCLLWNLRMTHKNAVLWVELHTEVG